jgi:hypothetical protein
MSCPECHGTGVVQVQFVYGLVDMPCTYEPERNEFGRWETPAMTARAWARNEGRKHP